MVPCLKLSCAGWRAFSVAAPSVRRSGILRQIILRDSALELDSFRRQLNMLFAHYQAQRIRDVVMNVFVPF